MKRILKRTPATPLSPEVAAAIKRMRAEGLYYHQIAAELNINQGRIAEVMKGAKYQETKPANDDQLPFDFG